MSEDPREALLDVARDIVAKRGYVGLTMRTASAAAGVTPEVARRYYRNREALFAAAMRLPADPVSAIPTLMAPGIEGMGERLVRFTLDTLRDPEARDDIMSLARTGVSAGHAVTGLQDFIEVGVLDRIAGMIGVPDARMRSALITSYLMGVAIMRYGVRLEPLASASDEEVIRMVAPVIQDLLDPRHPIPGSARSRSEASSTTSMPDSPEQPRERSRKFDPDPAATRARQAAELAREAELVRERANADRRAATSSPGRAAGTSSTRTRAAAGKPNSTGRTSTAKPKPAGGPARSTGATAAGASRPASSPAPARKSATAKPKPTAPKKPPKKTPKPSEPQSTREDSRSAQKKVTTAKGGTTSSGAAAPRRTAASKRTGDPDTSGPKHGRAPKSSGGTSE